MIPLKIKPVPKNYQKIVKKNLLKEINF